LFFFTWEKRCRYRHRKSPG